MKKILSLVIPLTLIAAICAAVLAFVNARTKPRIADLQQRRTDAAAKDVLPANVKAFTSKPDPADAQISILVAYADEAKTQIAGYAVPGRSDNGYGGEIRLMVGLAPDRSVFSYQVLAANETPGLGAKLGEAEFVGQFKGKPGATLKVKKDGGEIDAITGATITSRAVCAAIADAVARVDRLEGKKPSAAAAQPAANPEGTLLFDPSDPKEALKMMPKGTVTATPITQERFPIFEGKDANGKTTGYAVVGRGQAHGPNGDLVLLVQYGGGPARNPLFNPPPRTVNKPAVEMTDMETAQRTAFNQAMQDVMKKLRALPR